MDLDDEGQAPEGDRCEEKENSPVTFGSVKKSGRGRYSRSNSTLRNRNGKSRSRSRSRTRKSSITASSKKTWKSANAWLNFMQDFRKNFRGLRGMRNADVFRLAGEQWSEMTAEEKRPYIEAANKVKRMKQLKKDNEDEDKRRSKKRSKARQSDNVSESSNRKKNNEAEENDDKTDSECDSGEEGSEKNAESDNASLDSNESV